MSNRNLSVVLVKAGGWCVRDGVLELEFGNDFARQTAERGRQTMRQIGPSLGLGFFQVKILQVAQGSAGKSERKKIAEKMANPEQKNPERPRMVDVVKDIFEGKVL